MLSCEAVVAETCFLLKRSSFDPSLALQFIERGVVHLPLVIQAQISSVSSLFKRYENVPVSLADAVLIRLAEINNSPLLLTTDRERAWAPCQRTGRRPYQTTINSLTASTCSAADLRCSMDRRQAGQRAVTELHEKK